MEIECPQCKRVIGEFNETANGAYETMFCKDCKLPIVCSMYVGNVFVRTEEEHRRVMGNLMKLTGVFEESMK